MEYITIVPTKLKGIINVPPSKSIAHRAIICGGLANGESTILNMSYSDDLDATINGMKSLGAYIKRGYNILLINGKTFMIGKTETVINCGESASTLRMLLPLALIAERNVLFTGKTSLARRPLNPYYEIFDKQGIEYTFSKNRLNLKVKGCLKNGDYYVRGDISSQFISGLLLALPLLNGDSKIIITTDLESRGYVDLTIDMLSKFGVYIENLDYKEFIIKGRQKLVPREISVEGDFSTAAFFFGAGALGNQIKCKGLNLNSLQGDKAVLDILRNMGCRIETERDYIMAYGSKTFKTTIDGRQIPDLIPILAVVASLSSGTTIIKNAARLRLKECDRLKAMQNELSKLGADIKELDDGLIINGKEHLDGGIVDSWNDHRIAMSLAIASTRCTKPVIIRNSGVVKKSYPGFWNDFKSLGGIIN